MDGLDQALGIKPKRKMSPEGRAKMSAAMKRRHAEDQGYKNLISRNMKMKWKDPAYRAKMMHALGSPYARRKAAERGRGKRYKGAGGYQVGLTVGIMCRFEPKVFARLERYAQERHISFAESVRRLVLYGLGR